MQYVALIYSNEADDNARPEAERNAEFARYYAFNKLAREQGALLGGEPLQPISTATSVRVRNGEVLLTDGPFAETREQLGGFYLLECRDLDHAIELAREIPTVENGTIEIRPVMLLG